MDVRDTVWQHPDLLPTAADLDEPAGFIDRMIGGDTSGIDRAIADLEKQLLAADDDAGRGTSPAEEPRDQTADDDAGSDDERADGDGSPDR